MSQPFSITFCGGAGAVTGANFLVEPKEKPEARFIVDCGLHQGSKIFEEKNREAFSYNPAELSATIITHAHLDHVGRLPKLVRDGFRGPIYSTPPTKDLAELILLDSLGVMEKEARGSGKPPFYSVADVEQAMTQWQTVEYGKSFKLGGGTATFHNAGHILGSAVMEWVWGETKTVFTGDLGNVPSTLLPPPQSVAGAHYLVMESVYGDRIHEDVRERTNKLEDIIESTAKAGGTLMIPAFSIERTQEIIYEIEQMVEQGRIPPIPVFLDSPLAIKVTGIYSKYRAYMNKNVRSVDELFSFPRLVKTLTTDESKAIVDTPSPKIIIAGSGMSNGGRIIHHEKHYLPDPKSTLLLVGYQSAGSLGRQLQEGAKTVNILGQQVSVRARIAMITGYSAHQDSQGLLEYVDQCADSLKKVFVVMGEPKASLFLAQRIRDYLGVSAVVPRLGERTVIDTIKQK